MARNLSAPDRKSTHSSLPTSARRPGKPLVTCATVACYTTVPWQRSRNEAAGGVPTAQPLAIHPAASYLPSVRCPQRRGVPDRLRPRGRRIHALATDRNRRLSILEARRRLCDLRLALARSPTSLSSGPADGLHVRPVTAHHLSSLPPRATCFIGRPLVRRPLRVRRLSALAGDIALTRGIHRCESSLALPAHRPSHRQ